MIRHERISNDATPCHGLGAVLVIAWFLVGSALLVAGLWWAALIATAAAFWLVRGVLHSWRKSLVILMRDAGLPPAATAQQWKANVSFLQERK